METQNRRQEEILYTEGVEAVELLPSEAVDVPEMFKGLIRGWMGQWTARSSGQQIWESGLNGL